MISLIREIKHYLRRNIFFLRNFRHIKQFGKNILISGGKIICIGKNLYIGNFVSINEGVFLNASGGLKIGNYCRISPYAQIHTAGLDLSKSYKKRGHIVKSVELEDGVWLCAGVIVNPGVTIGEGSVVATGSVVTKNIPKFELWGGTPAKKIRSLS